jgi:hypothetical protein
MIEDTAKIVNEAIKDKVQVNLIINNRAGGNAPLIAEETADRLQKIKQLGLFNVFGSCRFHPSKSTFFPPTQVSRTGISSMCFLSTLKGSSPSITISASLPGSRVPLRLSSKDS